MTRTAHVERWTTASKVRTALLGLAVASLFGVPYVFDPAVTQKLTGLWILVLMAAMWNALAGYGGLVSVGQQAFIGIGAYATIYISRSGVDGYLSMLLAIGVTFVLAIPTAWLVLRMRGGAFAIAMWVVAEVFRLLVSLDLSVGGGTGISFTGLNVYDIDYRRAYTYWFALAAAVVFLLLIYALLRSRIGVSLQAIRDDEQAASSLGVRVDANRRLIFILTSTGCGAAGAAILANTTFVEPGSIFSVTYTAEMIFMVLVGGLGTFEGPVVGAAILFALTEAIGNAGVWYLVGLGATAIVVALFLPRGLWGSLVDRISIPFAPIGYWVRVGRGEEVAGAAETAGDTAADST